MPVDPEIMAKAREFIGHRALLPPQLVTARDIRRFAIAIGDKNPVYRDSDYAKSLGHGDIIAPPMFHTAFALLDEDLDQLEPSGLGPNMGPRFEVPVPGFTGAVAGGRDVEFIRPVQPGDTISLEEKVVDVYEKEGRNGPMIFIVSEHTARNQRGEPVTIERQVLIRHR